MNCKMHEGDPVIIKNDFFNIKPTSALGITDDMYGCAGKETEIRIANYRGNLWYKIKDSNWVWDENWLEPVPTVNISVNENEIMEMFK